MILPLTSQNCHHHEVTNMGNIVYLMTQLFYRYYRPVIRKKSTQLLNYGANPLSTKIPYPDDILSDIRNYVAYDNFGFVINIKGHYKSYELGWIFMPLNWPLLY